MNQDRMALLLSCLLTPSDIWYRAVMRVSHQTRPLRCGLWTVLRLGV
jgi:hypothetical protein